MKKELVFILLCALCVSVSYTQSIPKESIYFDFRLRNENESSVLYLDVNDNQLFYEKLVFALKSDDTKNQILANNKYISLVSCIMRMDINEAEIINKASEQASVIRALLKTKFAIPHQCIAFSIDTTQGRRNRVYVDIFDGDLPQGSVSNDIQYIQRGKPDRIFDLYQYGVPYGNYWMILKKNNRIY